MAETGNNQKTTREEDTKQGQAKNKEQTLRSQAENEYYGQRKKLLIFFRAQ